MELMDIGVNLTHRRFDADRDAVVARAQAAGVGIVSTGTSVANSREAARLATEYGHHATAGVHPHDAAAFDLARDGDALRALARDAVAVGECGLDFDRDFSPRDAQERVFVHHLELASSLDKPLFLHERSAHRRMLDLLDAHRGSRAVVHCFTGSGDELDAYLERDLYIGVTGWICDERRGLGLREIVGRVPVGRLMIETDAPFLTPRTMKPKPKGGRNEPAFLTHVAQAVADARGESLEELAAHTTATARAFFRQGP